MWTISLTLYPNGLRRWLKRKESSVIIQFIEETFEWVFLLFLIKFLYISWAFYLSLKAHYWWFGYEAFAMVTSIAEQITIATKCHYVQYQMNISVWRRLNCYCLLRIAEIKLNPKIGYVARHSASTVIINCDDQQMVINIHLNFGHSNGKDMLFHLHFLK